MVAGWDHLWLCRDDYPDAVGKEDDFRSGRTEWDSAVAKRLTIVDAESDQTSLGCMTGRIEILSEDIFSSGEVWDAERNERDAARLARRRRG